MRRQAAAADRARALAAVLERALAAAGGRPARPLPRLATAFAAEQVAAAAEAAAAPGGSPGVAGDELGGGAAAEAHAGYGAVMQQALAQLEARFLSLVEAP